jgi:hypothetical protein
MDLKRITDKAKELVEKRGGTGSLKEDASELKDIATGEGSLTDKAKAAAEAIKDPGAERASGEPAAPVDPTSDDPPGPEGDRRRRRHPGRRRGRAN